MQQRTVFLIPSDDLRWAALRASIREIPEAHIIGEATNAHEAIETITASHPDVVISAEIVDGTPARQVFTQLRRTSCPTTRFVVFSAHLDPDDIAPFTEIGLAGHLLWSDLSAATLPSCLSAVLQSNIIVVSPAVVHAFFEAHQNLRQRSEHHTDPSLEKVPNALTRQHRVILRLVEEGLTTDEIAARLSRSPGTVKKHLAAIYKRLHIHDRETAVRMAHERGYLP
jgi:DNA-binding NarL/FixJ family response regulator